MRRTYCQLGYDSTSRWAVQCRCAFVSIKIIWNKFNIISNPQYGWIETIVVDQFVSDRTVRTMAIPTAFHFTSGWFIYSSLSSTASCWWQLVLGNEANGSRKNDSVPLGQNVIKICRDFSGTYMLTSRTAKVHKTLVGSCFENRTSSMPLHREYRCRAPARLCPRVRWPR